MIKFIKTQRKGTISRSFSILSKQDQKKIIVVAAIQVLLSALDLLGVVAIGLLGALSVSGLQSKSPGTRINNVLDILHISKYSFQTQATLIGIFAIIILLGRTIVSIFFTRRILRFFSRRGASLSASLISRLLAQPLLKVQKRTTQETLFAITRGVESIVMQVLATGVVIISDISLLIVIGIGLFVIDPSTALGTLVVFGLLGFALDRFMHIRARELGQLNSSYSIKSSEKIMEVLASYRESVVRNRRDYYSRTISKLRLDFASNSAELNFLPYVSKYVIETAVILGALLIGIFQFIMQDAAHAVATLSIFLAAGTRIAPAVLRLQQGLIQIRSAMGQAEPTLVLIDDLGKEIFSKPTSDEIDSLHIGFQPRILVKDISLKYPEATDLALKSINLEINPGQLVAIVGSSGAGKTTLVDAILGVLQVGSGEILISGTTPLDAISKWPGAISYVPQDVLIIAGTIRENVAMGYPIELATDDLVMNAIDIAHLKSLVESLPNGLETIIGERGVNLSGGQRQRLGIARAMFTQPKLLILDEATSSLDGETEFQISESILKLSGKTTVLMIAHRLSTVRNSEVVIYLEKGEVKAMGNFEQVRNISPDFDRQAKLMGL